MHMPSYTWPQHWNWLSCPFQNGLMVKVTETCPELNCTVSDQILPDGRCCNVCRGMSSSLLHSSQLHESLFLWTCTDQSPDTVRSKQSQSAGCLFRLWFCNNSFSPPSIKYECFLAEIPIRADWSVCYRAPAMPICLNPAALAGRYYRVNSHW